MTVNRGHHKLADLLDCLLELINHLVSLHKLFMSISIISHKHISSTVYFLIFL